MKKNNRGMTVVEIVVTTLIIVVCIIVLSISVGLHKKAVAHEQIINHIESKEDVVAIASQEFSFQDLDGFYHQINVGEKLTVECMKFDTDFSYRSDVVIIKGKYKVVRSVFIESIPLSTLSPVDS